MSADIQIDAFPPAKMASRMEDVGVNKSKLNIWSMFALGILAGAFIACGAIFATTVGAGASSTIAGGAEPLKASMPFGVMRLLQGLVFCLGLIAVVVAGAELFTGNTLIIMAFASGKVGLMALLRNWGVVYVGNLVGSLLTAVVMFYSKQYSFGSGAIGIQAVTTANAKVGLGFMQAVMLGIMCNALVCLAVWLCSSARSTTDKILAIIFPISAFVAAGFEHSIANMYFIPIGILIKDYAGTGFLETLAGAGLTADKLANLTWYGFFIKNLLPVTIGNIIGGAGFVGLVYWFIYLRTQRKTTVAAGAPKRVLVVDDDPDFVEVTRTILTKEGYKVATAANGEQALSMMKAETPSLVLLDVMMRTPLEGVAVSQKMFADPALKAIPIVMISSIDCGDKAGLLPDNVQIPIDAWIDKPVKPETLLAAVRRFVR
jgi:formate/nitrite transporter